MRSQNLIHKADGVLLLDKEAGITSNKVLQQVKRIFLAQKIGHTGALDPLATGMLPICLGQATKFSQYLLDSDKRYQVTAKLGQRTSTSDADGDMIENRPVCVSWAQVEKQLNLFRGITEQIPSIYSAIKYRGKPMYWYARKGIEVPRKSRMIEVYSIDLLSLENDLLRMDIYCSKGTYIRTIVDDLGERLGCGAHVIQLNRSHVADYPSGQMIKVGYLEQLFQEAELRRVSPSQLLEPLLLPIDSAVSSLVAIELDESLADRLLHGQAVMVPGATQVGPLRLYTGSPTRFVGVGERNSDGLITPTIIVLKT